MSGSNPPQPGEARSENAQTETHISPQRFAQVRAIFEAALERPSGEWKAYVAGACGGDTELEKEVLAMLAADDAAGPTELLNHPAASPVSAPPSSHSSSAPDEGRFPAGANLAGRYRILGLLGRGGMGEVYRAFDAKLDQTVALKFLPESMAHNPRLLERFRGEVRMARQVSHRNVCRVYDLGEFEDMPFLTMEYVDGEDLRGLLRRIGRLPGDKALEIARKLCAGLAAAHEKGILHRDLKPANIMIDGQGQVRIMDFGLAAVADAIPGADIRSGTPAYMAPEQLAGKEVTVQSDIYSLGLLLYEIFTGQPAHKGADRSATPPTATSVVKEIDPVVERVIERCLDPNPANRPESALALARMLPGGDPLAEALAAGDTPTPAMVASSDDVGKLPVWALSACMGFVVVALVVLMYWSGGNYLNATPTPYSPDVLEQRARDFIAEFGYPDPPADWDLRFETDVPYRDWAARNEDPQEARRLAQQGRPAPMLVTYSQSSLPMLPADPLGQITESDPARTPGWIDLTQDLRGRLTYFLAVPERGEKALPNPVGWPQLFEAAGLEIGRWKATEPQETPPVAFDAQAAWTGTYPDAPDIPLRIEAAAWKGRPVSFEIFGPWRPERAAPQAPVLTGLGPLLAIGFLFAPLFAFLNLRAGRGDLHGAFRLGAYCSTTLLLAIVLRSHFVFASGLIPTKIAASLLVGVTVWSVYMAVEPFLRKRWPHALVSWTRLLAGKLRDPLVGGHILVGVSLGLLINLVNLAYRQFRGTLELPQDPAAVTPVGMVVADIRDMALVPLVSLAMLLVFLLVRAVTRNTWVAAAALLGVMLSMTLFAPPQNPITQMPFGATLFVALFLFAVLRFGIVAGGGYMLAEGVTYAPFTSDFSAWFAPAAWVHVVFLAGVAAWGFRNALAGRKVWQGPMLEG